MPGDFASVLGAKVICSRTQEKPDRNVAPMAKAELIVSSDLAELKRVRAFVGSVCEGVDAIDANTAREIELAVHEAASNIIEHAYRGRKDQEIRVEAEVSEEGAFFRLYHSGEMLDPKVLSPELDHSPHLAIVRGALQQERHLGVRGHRALREEDAAAGVDAGGDRQRG